MKKNTLLMAGLLTLFLLGSGVVNTSAATEAKIGLLSPMTGALGVLGPTFENGAKLAIEDLNAAQDDYEFSLVLQDTKTDPTGASEGMTALANAGVSGVVGAAASSSTLSAMPIAKDSEIPMISYASTSPSISTADDGDFLFRVVPSDAFQGQAAAELAKEKGLTKIAIIGINDAYGQGLVGAFKDAFEANGGTVTANIPYEVTNADFTSQITNMADSNPEGIFMVSFVDDGALILDAIRANSVLKDLPIIGTDGIATASMYDSVSNSSNFQGVIGVVPKLSDDAAFASKYNDAYGEDVSVFVAEAYDATMIIGKAILKADDTQSCKVADNLRTAATEYTDAVTGTITFDSNGDRSPPATYNFWTANGTDIVVDDSFTLTGDGAKGDIPETHCSSSGNPLPFYFGPFAFGMIAIAVVVRRFRK